MFFRAFLLSFVLMLAVGCGYKPSSYYTHNILRDKIYVDVESSLQDPENTVLIKDAINEVLVSKFHAKLVSKDRADAKLFVKLKSVSFEPIQYDQNGFVIAYKTLVVLDSKYESPKEVKNIITKGEYDFPIKSNSVISDRKRFEAIKFASKKAIGEFISKIAVEGMLNDDK
ncbi:MAG: hypothetical protein GXO31_00435 [Epsilonproteobacteria bacterium]|nr:hypothetical protein [Campylobacterota bacterium]